MELPTVDCDKTFGVVLKHETKLTDKSDACIQAALLYTNAQGERRIRVHSICLPVTSGMCHTLEWRWCHASLWSHCDYSQRC